MKRLEKLLNQIADEPQINGFSETEEEFLREVHKLKAFHYQEYLKYLMKYNELTDFKIAKKGMNIR